MQIELGPHSSVLVLGGSNFMGKSLVLRLASLKCRVTCVNRMKPHWNNEISEVRDDVRMVYGDRDCHVEYAKLLAYITEKEEKETGRKSFEWDAVVDFCGYIRKEVKSVIRGLKGKAKLYVFISTDSVYDVCDQKMLSTPVKEEEAVRPQSNKELYKRAEEEEYGHDKMRCEEYLQSHVGGLEDGLPFVCLRLPDVIGPYDSTARYWTYLLWLQKMSEWPIHSKEESRKKQLSFVFSEDVVTMVITLITKSSDRQFLTKVHGQAFNLAFSENPTLDQLVQVISDNMGLGRVNFVDEKELSVLPAGERKGKFFYPSVYCPHLDISKAKKVLDWNPSTLEDAIKITNNFFAKSSQYPMEMKKVASKILKVQEYYEQTTPVRADH